MAAAAGGGGRGVRTRNDGRGGDKEVAETRNRPGVLIVPYQNGEKAQRGTLRREEQASPKTFERLNVPT